MAYYPALLASTDLTTIRALLLPSIDAGTLQTLLSNDTLLSPVIVGHAEAIVMQRLGTDWPLFSAANAGNPLPTYYAQGNTDVANRLCHDALVQFCCAQLLAMGIVQQLVAATTTIDGVTITYDLDWDKQRDAFIRQGYAALDLLRRAFPVPGRRFLSPTGGASGQLRRGMRAGTQVGWRGRGDWRDEAVTSPGWTYPVDLGGDDGW